MRAEPFYLVNDRVKQNAIKRLRDQECDGKTKVVFMPAGSKSAKQRGLQWRWYTDVALAGIGGRHEDTKEGVHLVSKYRWAIRILARDDNNFADLFLLYWDKYKGDKEKMLYFTDKHVSTEDMSNSQMAEYLTDFQRHYAPLCRLSDPQDWGLLKAA